MVTVPKRGLINERIYKILFRKAKLPKHKDQVTKKEGRVSKASTGCVPRESALGKCYW